MTRPRTPPTHPADDTMAQARHAKNHQAPESIPEGEFNDESSSAPVDPAMIRDLEIPEKLLDLFLASLPRYEGPDDLSEAAPPARKSQARNLPWPDLEEPLFEATPITGVEPPRRPSPTARPYVTIDVSTEPEATTTAAMHARRPLSLLDRMALTGKIPMQVKLGFTFVFACLLALLAWIQLEQSIAMRVSPARAIASEVDTVPLLDAPVANPLGAQEQAVAQPTRAVNAPSVGIAIDHAMGKSTNQTAPIAKESKKPDKPAASVNKPPPKSASTSLSGLTPIFEPR
jgi:hypothetical protein